jgi:hypothetical protein
MRLGRSFARVALVTILMIPRLGEAQTVPSGRIQHVLLLSIDGFHGVDLANYVAANPSSTLAQLSATGVTYRNAASSKPSDSFPGLLAIVTGGSTVSHGVFYDDSYDRALSPPGSNCQTVGTEVLYDGSINKDPNALDGGGGIDPAKLPLDPSKGCAPVYPHNYLRVNTIFEVIHAAGMRTAWCDKHLSYEIVNGPSGVGVDDLYTPEIDSSDITGDENATQAYDDLKVQAVLNQIDGKNSSGAQTASVPAIFGMNFQAVSVGQKLSSGGYTDVLGTPGSTLSSGLNHTDGSIGRMVAELKAKGLYDSTLIIVTAKHGQSPIDKSKRRAISSDVIPGLIDGVQSGLTAFTIEDDASLVWLTDQSKTTAAVSALSSNQAQAGIQKIFAGEALKAMFNDPASDSRVPDMFLQPDQGVIYTGGSKIAEHGGLSEDDTHVALLVAGPGITPTVIKSPVQTMQIAPTILNVLALNPQTLQAVALEHTAVLPGFAGSARIVWIAPQSTVGFGPAGSLVLAGTASGATAGTGVVLHWRNATTGSEWTTAGYAPSPESSGTWYNTIPNANATQQYQVYVTYGASASGNCTYVGDGALNSCP